MNNKQNYKGKILFLLILILTTIIIALSNGRGIPGINKNTAQKFEDNEIEFKDEINNNKTKKSSNTKSIYFNEKEDNLDKYIKNSKPTLITFGAEWCSYCQDMKPILENLSSKNKDIDILYIDVDNYPEIAKNYPVNVTPSTILFNKDGEPLKVTEEIFKKYGIDAFSSTKNGPIVASAFFGIKTEEEIQSIIDNLLLVKEE